MKPQISKMAEVRLKALAKYFVKLQRECDDWTRKNAHRCGHSNTADGLGDEGWIRLHEDGGKAVAFMTAASQLNKLIEKLKGDRK